MKTLPPALATHVAGGLTTLCRCWRVDRRDGVVMGFTDFDRDLVFDAVTYKAASGFTATIVLTIFGITVFALWRDPYMTVSVIAAMYVLSIPLSVMSHRRAMVEVHRLEGVRTA